MASLSTNWITEKHIDFEYKKYVLLAYLQEVSDSFNESRLYPYLGELVAHYKCLVSIKENKKNLYESFPGRLSSLDYSNFKLLYEKMLEDDQLMKELENIIDFSIPQFEKYLADGKKIYDFIESKISIFPVGIVPLNAGEGYLFLKIGKQSETTVFQYQITIFENPDERYRGIYTQYVCSYERSLANSYESIKQDLLRYNKKLPNPATYVIETDLAIPMENTFLPMAKRSFVKFVANNVVN